MKWLVGTFFVLVSAMVSFAGGETFWVSQAGSGNRTGLDATNTQSSAWFNAVASWAETPGCISPGDVVCLVGNITNQLTIGGSGRSNEWIKILFSSGATMSVPAWIGGKNAAIYANGKEFICVDGATSGLIECTDNGSGGGYFNNTLPCTGVRLDDCTNFTISRLIIKNIYQARTNEVGAHTHSSGISVVGGNLVISSNVIEMAGTGIYIGMKNTENVELKYNTISRCAAGVFCGITKDGYWGRNVHVHHNRIFDTTNWGYNDGIKFFGRPATTDEFSNVEIDHNVIGPGISTPGHPGTAWILVDQGWFIEPWIHNNVLLGGINDNAANGYITVGGTHQGNMLPSTPVDSRVYNNTISSQSTNTDVAIMITKKSHGHRIYNNAVSFSSKLLPVVIADTNYASIAYSDYNVFHSTSSVDIAPWLAKGWDGRSNTNDPEYFDPLKPAGVDGEWWTSDDGLRPRPGSPLHGNGMNGADIGAHNGPSPPNKIRVE